MNKNTLHRYSYEYTDTFCGERNYCWIKRGIVHATNDVHAMRKARKELGLTGAKGRYIHRNDGAEWRPYNCATILTILDEVSDNA